MGVIKIIFQCSKKDNEKEFYLCDLDTPQRPCMAETTLNRNINFLDMGTRDWYLTIPASPLWPFVHS